MWILGKEFKFEASHVLPHHEGKCGRLHGHSWKGVVYVQGESLQTQGSSQGMIMDYADIKAVLKPLIEDYLDHYHLNDSLELDSPTSEAVSQWVYERLQQAGLPIAAVQINETCTSRCLYTELHDFSNAVLVGGLD